MLAQLVDHGRAQFVVDENADAVATLCKIRRIFRKFRFKIFEFEIVLLPVFFKRSFIVFFRVEKGYFFI